MSALDLGLKLKQIGFLSNRFLVVPSTVLNFQAYWLLWGGACRVMVIVVESSTVTRVQILDEAICISHSTNILGKGMNTTILP